MPSTSCLPRWRLPSLPPRVTPQLRSLWCAWGTRPPPRLTPASWMPSTFSRSAPTPLHLYGITHHSWDPMRLAIGFDTYLPVMQRYSTAASIVSYILRTLRPYSVSGQWLFGLTISAHCQVRKNLCAVPCAVLRGSVAEWHVLCVFLIPFDVLSNNISCSVCMSYLWGLTDGVERAARPVDELQRSLGSSLRYSPLTTCISYNMWQLQ